MSDSWTDAPCVLGFLIFEHDNELTQFQTLCCSLWDTCHLSCHMTVCSFFKFSSQLQCHFFKELLPDHSVKSSPSPVTSFSFTSFQHFLFSSLLCLHMCIIAFCHKYTNSRWAETLSVFCHCTPILKNNQAHSRHLMHICQ